MNQVWRRHAWSFANVFMHSPQHLTVEKGGPKPVSIRAKVMCFDAMLICLGHGGCDAVAIEEAAVIFDQRASATGSSSQQDLPAHALNIACVVNAVFALYGHVRQA